MEGLNGTQPLSACAPSPACAECSRFASLLLLLLLLLLMVQHVSSLVERWQRLLDRLHGVQRTVAALQLPCLLHLRQLLWHRRLWLRTIVPLHATLHAALHGPLHHAR